MGDGLCESVAAGGEYFTFAQPRTASLFFSFFSHIVNRIFFFFFVENLATFQPQNLSLCFYSFVAFAFLSVLGVFFGLFEFLSEKRWFAFTQVVLR